MHARSSGIDPWSKRRLNAAVEHRQASGGDETSGGEENDDDALHGDVDDGVRAVGALAPNASGRDGGRRRPSHTARPHRKLKVPDPLILPWSPAMHIDRRTALKFGTALAMSPASNDSSW